MLNKNLTGLILDQAISDKQADATVYHLSDQEQAQFAQDLVERAIALQPILHTFERAKLREQEGSNLDFLAQQVADNQRITDSRPKPAPRNVQDAVKHQETWKTQTIDGTHIDLGFPKQSDN